MYDTTTSPTGTASSESPAFLSLATNNLLMYDQHSSEEELEVINGPAGTVTADDVFDVESPKRPSTTTIENRKRSLVQNSDDEVGANLSIIFPLIFAQMDNLKFILFFAFCRFAIC